MVRSNEAAPPCPTCGGNLQYRDSRQRICRHEGGARDTLVIRRFRCAECNRHHNELPDCVVPYKHYDTEVISGVLDGVVSADDSDSEDYPVEITMQRWLQWYKDNRSRMEGYLRNAAYLVLEDTALVYETLESYLEAIQKSTIRWLESVIRIIYNSGGYLCPVSI